MAENQLFPISEADLFVVNDAYRPTPTDRILRWLSESNRLRKTQKFLIATGCHEGPNEYQMKAIFGDMYAKIKGRLLVHDARDKNEMVQIGEDSEQHPIFLNRHFHEAEKVVIVGSVEPHYFAGFTGGRKSVFPGLCDYDTTVRNHRLGVSFEAAPLRLDKNPIEENLRELMHLVCDKEIFSIQMVMGKEGHIEAIFCGDIQSSFRRACEHSAHLFSYKTGAEYDLVLAEVRSPLDTNLYQLQKSLENSQTAVRNGGSMILFSRCHEGIGPDSFYNLADKWKSDTAARRAGTDDFGIHKLARVAQIGQRIDIWLYSELEDGISDKVFFKTTKNPQEIIDRTIQNKNGVRTAVVRDAGHTVLRAH